MRFRVLVYWLLLIGAIAVAVENWRRDPAQRTQYHLSVFTLRVVAAGMWWLGTLWKLPLPVSGGFRFWLQQTVKYSSFRLHADGMHAMFALTGAGRSLGADSLLRLAMPRFLAEKSSLGPLYRALS